MAKRKDEFVPHSGDPVTLENVPVIYKNFSGQKGQYNEEGEKSFNIIIEDSDMAAAMLSDGFNLKPFLDEDDVVTAYHLHVKINYKSRRPPRIYRIADESSRPPLLLDERTVKMLDSVDIIQADITLGTWVWREEPLPNISAYCNVMYALIQEDPLDAKYAPLFESEMYEELE